MILKWLILVSLCNSALGYNSYLLVCPDTIRPAMEFSCQFTKLDKTLPSLKVTARIISSISEDEDIASTRARIRPYMSSATLEMNLPMSLPNAQYTLEVKGQVKEEDLFVNTTFLNYMSKSMSIFVQTDKAIYKQGQLVQFRVVATRSDLSVVDQPLNVSIFDPRTNKIAQWQNVEGDMGVFKGELQLSERPPLGDWKIDVDYEAESSSKIFTVAEYVLPKFEVSITIPKFAVVTDKYLSGTVFAKYMNGKGVEGKGTLTIRRKYGYRSDLPMISLSFKLNVEYHFEVEVSELETLITSLRYTTLLLEAEVEEGLTGYTRTASEEIIFYDREERMVFLNDASHFKPGLSFTAYLFISDQDRKPLSSYNSQVSITVSMYYDATQMEPTTMRTNSMPIPEEVEYVGPISLDVSENGIVPYTFKVPIYIKRITLQASFKGLTQRYYVSAFQSISKNYIQIELLTRKPMAGSLACFRIKSTETNIKAVYMILSMGQVVTSGKLTMTSNFKKLKVNMSAEMTPSASMVVYYVRKDAEIVADSVQFNVRGVFKNDVNVKYMSRRSESLIESSKPGETVKIKVTADPGSVCHVLSVDKSVLLLKSGNDIEPNQVLDELESYVGKETGWCSFFECLKYFYFQTNGPDAAFIFEHSRLVVLTDAFLYRNVPLMEDDASAPETNAATTTTRVRNIFPETWLFDSAVADENGNAIIEAVVPDTITSWVTSAFAVHKDSGLGVAMDRASLEVFLNFFVRLDLPYSVIRGEQVILVANVFNYFDNELEVDVSLAQSPGFKNIIVQRTENGTSKLDFEHSEVIRTVKVPANGAVAVKFPIKPVEIGNIDLTVKAASAVAGDVVRKQLLVEAEGILEEYGIPMLIDLRETSTFSGEAKIALDEYVGGSARIRVSLIGDIMGLPISYLTNLLRMPYGCGEQNIITFVPNIYAVRYLENINSLTPSNLTEAKGHMLNGYQTELTYQHYDGSFTIFGLQDDSGSTWVTAYVVKSFAQATPYIHIDPKIMKDALDWLLMQYDEEKNVFREPGRVYHGMQGGSATSEQNLAAYVIVAMLEARKAEFTATNEERLTHVIEAVIESLETSINDSEDMFGLAITGYALKLAKSSKVGDVLHRLENMAIKEGGMKYWMPETPPELQYTAAEYIIETTAYVLLTYALENNVPEGINIMKWLVKQIGPNGGFYSTQDTIVALQALSEFAGLIYSDGIKMQIEVTSQPSGEELDFNIDVNNALLLQTAILQENTESVLVEAKGSGMALAQITVSYNVWEKSMEPMFELQLSYTDETLSGFKLKACFRHLGTGSSGMAVMEIGLLSGFSAFSADHMLFISEVLFLKRFEDGRRSLNLYFSEVPTEELCFVVTMFREGLVAGSQPAEVKLYDYYQPGNQVTSMYQPELLKDSNICDIDSGEMGCKDVVE